MLLLLLLLRLLLLLLLPLLLLLLLLLLPLPLLLLLGRLLRRRRRRRRRLPRLRPLLFRRPARQGLRDYAAEPQRRRRGGRDRGRARREAVNRDAGPAGGGGDGRGRAPGLLRSSLIAGGDQSALDDGRDAELLRGLLLCCGGGGGEV